MDAPYVLERLGPDRAAAGAYVWQKLLKSGARIANGTDAPVEDVDPIASFYASVSRKLKDRTVFMDFRTDPTENVWPIVKAGKGITEMLLGSEDL